MLIMTIMDTRFCNNASYAGEILYFASSVSTANGSSSFSTSVSLATAAAELAPDLLLDSFSSCEYIDLSASNSVCRFLFH